jgi:hypothetical protein
MSRNFNPSIRTIGKLALQIPEQERLKECSWPTNPNKCETAQKINLITSASRKENVDRYEVRSITNEPQESAVDKEEAGCTIGPEYYPLFKDDEDVRTLAEALVDAEVRIGNVKTEMRDQMYETIVKTVKEDMMSRGRLLVFYGVYFAVGLFFLIDNYARGTTLASVPVLEDRLSQLVLNTVPLLASFYLHMAYEERVRTGKFLHILPLAILISYFVMNMILRAGRVSGVSKTVLVVLALTVLIISFYLVMSLRTTYVRCSARQTGGGVNSSWLVVVAMFGVILPTVLQGFSYLSIS